MTRFRPGKQKAVRATPKAARKAPSKKKAKKNRPLLLLKGDKVVFDLIIPLSNGGFKDFEHRAANLKTILAKIPAQVHVILVEQTIADKHRTYKSQLKVPESCNHTWICVKAPIFNKSWLYNIGARNSKTTQLLFSEADIALKPEYFGTFFNWITNRKYQWCIAWNRIIYWQKDQLRRKATHQPYKGGPEGGVVYMSKSFFWKIGGYNEWMQRLGGIDNEIIRRAEATDKRSQYFPWIIDHLWHPASKYKTNTTRAINKQIYKSVQKNPQQMIRILTRHVSQAGGKTPLFSSRIPKWL